jgi:hypothetical protein
MERHGREPPMHKNERWPVKARIPPHVLGDDLVGGAARQVKVDEVGEQSHGSNGGDVFLSSCFSSPLALSSPNANGRSECLCVGSVLGYSLYL